MTRAAPLRRKADRTRVAILEAAEVLFAEQGFAATRLEDVAERVGIRRASIVYHFRDKRELYDAVLADVLGGLYERIEAALFTAGPLAGRVEAAVAAWVDYVSARPSLARLLLREVADAAPGRSPAMLAHTRPFVRMAEQLEAAGRGDPEAVRMDVDPVRLAATIAGATVFLVAAMPSLMPEPGFDPLQPERLAAHRRDVLSIARRLLGAAARAADRRAGGPGHGGPRRTDRR